MYVCLDINPMLVCQFRDILIINSINFKNLYFNLYLYMCRSAFDGNFLTLDIYLDIFYFIVDLFDGRLSFNKCLHSE